MCFAQEDLLKWGAVVALGRRDAEDVVPYNQNIKRHTKAAPTRCVGAAELI